MFRRKPTEPGLPPEWLIAGLGNPGPDYAGTRHNVGFEVVDALAKETKIKVGTRKHRGVYGVGGIGGVSIALLKPMTFMNLSGQCINLVMREFSLKPDRLIVVTDDLDLEVGRIRARTKGGSGGHNGHRSIIASIGTQDYARIKIGIGKGSEETIDHVLSRFLPDERSEIDRLIAKIVGGLQTLGSEGIDGCIQRINTA